MTSPRQPFAILLFTISLILVASCELGEGEVQTTPLAGYKSYRHDGLSLDYPNTWALAYDSTPSIYTTRGVGFEISEFSSATILIEKDKRLMLSQVMDHFIDELQLETKDTIEDFTRSTAKINGHPAQTIKWKDTFLGKTQYELTVARVTDTPYDVFSVFSLSDEDIKDATPHLAAFTSSIGVE
ncbi:hypothetical protein [Microbulbifer halophilus]|uniref:PsbP C-terminal domain-containing protein n=1 Tax=Microbulbifer halophilus TaxID=453963 RepID=A0ABW5E8B9_9GAMM|nr:hypothetical protein [Microbulbifer halophilus]MCW8125284.1 hypothetical protein [Microbulbifer halophilus]